MIDRFILMTGMVADGDWTKEAQEALNDSVFAYVSAGGHLTMEMWETMAPQTRAAFTTANRAWEEIKARMVAQAFLPTEDDMKDAAAEAALDALEGKIGKGAA